MKVHYNIGTDGRKVVELDEHSDEILLRHRGITSIDLSVFSLFPYLKRLYLDRNAIDWISLYSLKNCHRLEYLDLSNNGIRKLDLDSLLHCERFEELNLSRNGFEEIDLSQLSGHPSFKKINLSYNKISEISLKALEGIPALTSLLLFGNQLESANLEPLSKCTNLMHLDLGNNSIRKIDLSPLRQNTLLRHLSVSQNKLESIELVHLTEVESLETLDLSYNRLRKIDLYPLHSCRLLKTINLQGNDLQELDLSPLFNCINLAQLSIDKEISLRADRKFMSIGYTPEGIQTHIRRVLFVATKEVSPPKPPKRIAKAQKRVSFIDPKDFSGFMYELVCEINDSFEANCYVCTAFLSRKLMENLVVSIMSQKFGNDHPEYYMEKDRQGNWRTKSFHKTLRKFWGVFREAFIPFSPTKGEKGLDKLKKNMKRLKNDFNVDVHEVGCLRDEKSLLTVRSDLKEIIQFLKHIAKLMG
ncbi:MAG: leucine-rich repeat domain-containing protein [Candidatus Thorarchaeota archaeon]|jgi:hypothetical protein